MHGTVPSILKYAHFPHLALALRQELAKSCCTLNVLDVGCGPGNLAAFCRTVDRCCWIGIDLWGHQLRQAREKGIYEYLLQGNLIDGLPLKAESMDVIVCSEVLMYLPNVPYLLTEFHRVLRGGGKLFVYNAISSWPRLASAMKRWGHRLYHEPGSVAFGGEADWRSATRATRINYHSYDDLIRDIDVLDFHIVQTKAFRIFRNRLRLLNRFEKCSWYGRMTQYLATHHPQLSSDLMVTALKSEAGHENMSTF